MSTLELKEQLINRIQITDDDILCCLFKMLEFEMNNSENYKLNKVQKESIEISKKQITNGEVYTEEEANKLTD